MAEDCDDVDEAPDGSFADLQEDFASAIADFRSRASEDMAKRADGVAVGARTSAEPGQSFQPTVSYQPTFETKQPPFNPDPTLLAPHYEEGAGRPIPQRREIANNDDLEWEAVHPLRSDSVAVRTPDGEATDVIEAGGSYSVECSVANLGGTPARSAVVELFVEHLEPTASVDINEETGNFEVNGADYILSGPTTMANGSVLYAVFHQGGNETPPYSGILRERFLSSSRDRFFQIVGLGEIPVATDETEFTLDLWDVTRVEDEVTGAALNESGIHLARENVRDVNRNVVGPRTLRNHDLSGEVTVAGDGDGTARRRRVGKQRVSVPQNDSQGVTFEYEPESDRFPNADLPNPEGTAPGSGRAVTAFHVRAYSLATSEVPADWGQLDHTGSRFMARTEVRRTL